jgi:cbb3-type cytochrome oxidase subunit 3
MDMAFISDAARPYVMVAFVVVFVALLAWVLSPRRKARLEEHRNIPFKED